MYGKLSTAILYSSGHKIKYQRNLRGLNNKKNSLCDFFSLLQTKASK